MSVEKLYYSVDEASMAFCISRTTLYDRINKGEIKAVKFGSKTLIPKESLDEFFSKLLTFYEHKEEELKKL